MCESCKGWRRGEWKVCCIVHYVLWLRSPIAFMLNYTKPPHWCSTCTCSNELSVQLGGAQAGAGVVHGLQQPVGEFVRRGLQATALLQAGRGGGGTVGAAAAVQRNHT